MTTTPTNIDKAVAYVKSVLGITDTSWDAQLTLFVKAWISMIQQATWINLLEGTDNIKYFDWAGQREIFLNNFITWVSQVQINNEKRGNDFQDTDIKYVARSSWEIDFERWLPRGFQNIKVKFNTGFSDFDAIPQEYEALKMALALMVWNLKSNTATSWIQSESVSWTSLTYSKTAITSDVQELINKFIIVAI